MSRYRYKHGSTNIPIEWLIDNINVNQRREIQNPNILARYQSEKQEMKKVMKSKIDMIQRQKEILRAKEVESGEVVA